MTESEQGIEHGIGIRKMCGTAEQSRERKEVYYVNEYKNVDNIVPTSDLPCGLNWN